MSTTQEELKKAMEEADRLWIAHTASMRAWAKANSERHRLQEKLNKELLVAQIRAEVLAEGVAS